MHLSSCCHIRDMVHHRNHWLTFLFLLSNKLNSFRLIKTSIIILVIYRDFVILKRSPNVTASENLSESLSLSATPHVVGDNNVLPINNFNGNFFTRKQITFDRLQRRVNDKENNDLLSLSIENCTINTNCGITTCNTNINTTTLTSKNNSSRDDKTKMQLATNMTNTVTLKTNISISNELFSSSMSEGKFSSLSSTLRSSSVSPLLLQQQPLLSRPKRYLSFPEGSSFSVAVCFTVGIIGNPRYNYMSFGLNWGVAYDLPNTTWILNHLHGFAKRPIPVAVWHRRSRRSIYKEIECVVDNMGYNGRECVLRALCESRQYFQRTKMGMIGEMMRILFSLPKQRIFTRELKENTDIELYDEAYRKARSVSDCSEKYDCGFSLLELAFGKYSTPPDGYFRKH